MKTYNKDKGYFVNKDPAAWPGVCVMLGFFLLLAWAFYKIETGCLFCG